MKMIRLFSGVTACCWLTFFTTPASSTDSPNRSLYRLGAEACINKPTTSRGLFDFERTLRPAEPLLSVKPECVTLKRKPSLEAQPNCLDNFDPVTYERSLPAYLTLEANILQGRYCHKQVARTLEQVFEPSFDVPAKLFNTWSVEYIEQRWRDFLLQNTIRYSPEYEALVSIYEANLAAAQLWQEMVDCYEGNAEASRYSYSTGKWNCSNPKVEGAALKNRIFLYQENIRNIMTTAALEETRLKTESPYFAIWSVMQGRPVVSEMTRYPTTHPLFTQILLQVAVENFPIGNTMSLKEFTRQVDDPDQKSIGRLYMMAMQIFNRIPTGRCVFIGLWPSANMAVQKSIHTRALELLSDSGLMEGPKPLYDFGEIYNNCAEKRLPPVYQENLTKIALMQRRISRAYGEVFIPAFARPLKEFAPYSGLDPAQAFQPSPRQPETFHSPNGRKRK